MKTLLKWSAIVIGGLVLLVAVAVFVGLQLSERKKVRTVDVAVQPVAYASDAQALARGKYLFESRGCVDCHGANGAGRDFVKKADIHLAGANITPGGVTASYKPEDWVRTIRHGVKPNGQPLMVMP